MFKKVNIQCCDICGKHEVEVTRLTFFTGWGYIPSWQDPMAQKRQRIYVNFDLCEHCESGLREKVRSFSKDDRNDLLFISEMRAYKKSE